jgi:hypothetical protein
MVSLGLVNRHRQNAELRAHMATSQPKLAALTAAPLDYAEFGDVRSPWLEVWSLRDFSFHLKLSNETIRSMARRRSKVGEGNQYDAGGLSGRHDLPNAGK